MENFRRSNVRHLSLGKPVSRMCNGVFVRKAVIGASKGPTPHVQITLCIFLGTSIVDSRARMYSSRLSTHNFSPLEHSGKCSRLHWSVERLYSVDVESTLCILLGTSIVDSRPHVFVETLNAQVFLANRAF
jgi:hypothetical protein